MYNDNSYYYEYRPHHPSSPSTLPGGYTGVYMPSNAIQQQLDLGRLGHCFKSYWGGKEHIFKLIGISQDGLVVYIEENGQPGSVSNIDMVGLDYLGVTCPSPPWSGPTTGTTTGPTSGWPQCRWIMTPWGMKWICY